MHYTKLIRSGETYFPKEYEGGEMWLLGDFLRVEVGSNCVLGWKSWIKNPEYEDSSGNVTFLEKEEDNIIIGDIWAEDYYEFLFETTQKHFLEILDRWEELCKQQPKEIIIAKEGDKVTLEGRN